MLAVNKSFLSPLRGWDDRLSPAAPQLSVIAPSKARCILQGESPCWEEEQ
jgi:hypothetical protein